MKIRVVVYTKSEDEKFTLKTFLEHDDIACVDIIDDERAMMESITKNSADIILVSISDESMKSIFLNCQQIYLLRPSTTVVLTSRKLDMKIIQQANYAGVHNVVEFPQSKEVCVSMLKNVFENETKRMSAMIQGAEKFKESQMLMVYGAKGGIGKTTFALNVAAELAKRNKKTILLDFDIEFGDVAAHMGVDEKETLAELFQDNKDLDIDIIRNYVTVHDSGLHAILAPRTPEYLEVLQKEKVETLLGLLMKNYDYVIVDSAPTFSDLNLLCLEMATEVYFMVGLDMAVLKNSRKAIKILQALGMAEKIRIVVSKNEKSSIRFDDIANILGIRVWDAVAADVKNAVAALNLGILVSDISGKSKLKSEFVRIAKRIDEQDSDETGKKERKIKLFPKGRR